MAAGSGEQLIFRGGAGESDGAQDASAGSGDLLVGGAGDALFELGGAVAGEDEVRVGVDEAGGYAAVFGIDNLGVVGNFGFEFGIGADCNDAAVCDQESGVVR